MTGYIDKAKQKTLIAETKDIWTASQAAMSECYALYPESFDESCKFTSTIDGKVMHNLGRISNGALNALQKNPNDPVEANTSSRKISRSVLVYLDSADKSNAQYLFTAPSGKNTWDTTFNDYFGEKYKEDKYEIPENEEVYSTPTDTSPILYIPSVIGINLARLLGRKCSGHIYSR